MKMKRSMIVIVLLLLSADAFAQKKVQMPSSGRPEMVLLTPGDIADFSAAAPELKALGAAPQGTDAEKTAAAAQAMDVLKRHGFSQERFRNVSYSIALALSVLQHEQNGDERLATARTEEEKKLAEVKGKVSPEQYEQTRRQLDAALGTMAQIHNQPAENLRLVTEHRTALEAVLKPK